MLNPIASWFPQQPSYQVAEPTWILSTAELQAEHFTTVGADRKLAGPHNVNVTGTKKDIWTQQAIFIPFTLVEYLLQAQLSHKESFEVINAKVQEQGLQTECKSLLDFLMTNRLKCICLALVPYLWCKFSPQPSLGGGGI